MDIEVANYNTSTDPRSPFVQRPIVVQKDDTSVRRLLGREYSVERPGQATHQRHLDDEEFAGMLRELCPALSEDETATLVAGAGR